MAEMIGSLIYGEHKIPKRRSIWLPIVIGLVMLIAGVVVYKFANWRAERSVAQFLQAVKDGQYETAYARWDTPDDKYTMTNFLEDWGDGGYYVKNAKTIVVGDSHDRGRVVVVGVNIDSFKQPLRLRVDKETYKLSYEAAHYGK